MWTAQAMGRLLTGHGYPVTRDEDLLDTADAVGTPVRHRRSLGHSRAMVADRD